MFGPSGLSKRNFSKIKREKRDTPWLFGEFSSVAPASYTPAPAAPRWGAPELQPSSCRRPCPKHWGQCAPNPKPCGGPLTSMPKAPGTDYLLSSPCAQSPAAPSGCLEERWKCPAEGRCRALGDSSLQKDLTQCGVNYPEGELRVSASKRTKSKKVVCELPLIGAPQGQHNWWTKGLGGSRRALRNRAGGWKKVKSVAQEGRKAKSILPQHVAAKKTNRTGLSDLRTAKGFFLFFVIPSSFLSSFSFLFLLPSFLSFLFLLPFFFYLYFLISNFKKIPSSFLSFFLSLFLLPSFLPSFLFLFLLPSFLPFFFFFSHLLDNKTWSCEKNRVRSKQGSS